MGIFQERAKRNEQHILALKLADLWIEEFKIDYDHAEDKDEVVRRWFF